MTDEVLYRVENDVGWITLNRPDVKNAISPDQRDRVIELLYEDARCFVLTGSGGSFCSGADLRSGSQTTDSVADVIRKGAQRLIASIMDCPRPVIAAVDGVAAGIGVHMALACDLVIASEEARFIEVFMRRALVPDGGGAYLLIRLLGPQKAKELAFFGDDVSAEQAHEIGLVNKVVPARLLETTAREWAERLAQGPTLTLAATKKLFNSAHDVDRATAFDAEAIAQEENMKTEDAQEGVKSFVDRRKPRFEGR